MRTADLSTGIAYSTGGGNGQSVSVTSDATLLATGNGAVSNFTYFAYAVAAKLSDLPDTADFSDLYDQYKITMIELTFKPFQRSGSLFTYANNQSCGAIHYSVLDHDDAVQPTASNSGVQKLREYETFKEKDYFKDWKRSAVPRVAVALFGSAVFTAYGNEGDQWIDMVSTNVEHYAFKGIFEVFSPLSSTPTDLWFRPELKIWFSCREVR